MQRTTLPARLLRQRLRALLDALPLAASGDVASVHQARVASRRLRELLPILAEAAESPELTRAKKDVRRITRALGPVRELDVALGHLEEIGPRTAVSARSLAAVRRHLSAERQVHRRAMRDVVTVHTATRLRTRLANRARTRPVTLAVDAEVASARRRAARRAVRLREAVRLAGGLYVPERLHAVRVATKKLRYALEVERELVRSRAAARINVLKRLQEDLGRIHDFEILIERTREVQAALAGTDRRTATDLKGLVRTLERECRDGHAAFLRERQAILATCQAIIGAAREARPTFM